MSELAEFLNGSAGIRTTILREDGRALIRTHQDTREILEGNLRARGFYEPAEVRKNPMRLRWVARLPWVVVMELNLRGIMRGAEVIRGEEKRFFAFLDDGEHRAFRTDNGRRLRNLPKRGVA